MRKIESFHTAHQPFHVTQHRPHVIGTKPTDQDRIAENLHVLAMGTRSTCGSLKTRS